MFMNAKSAQFYVSRTRTHEEQNQSSATGVGITLFAFRMSLTNCDISWNGISLEMFLSIS